MKKSPRKSPRKSPKNYWKILSIAIVTFATGFLIGDLQPCAADKCENLGTNVFKATGEDFTTHQGKDGINYYLGSEEAPVTIVEYTDYQCPYCQRYFLTSYPLIKENFIKIGAVKYIVKELPLPFHQQARSASYATRCAGEQDKFWEMHESVYKYQQNWSGNSEVNEVLVELATELELDTEEFTICLEQGPEKFDTIIDENLAEATSIGFSGTPSFMVGDYPIIGAQPFSSFETIINGKLK